MEHGESSILFTEVMREILESPDATLDADIPALVARHAPDASAADAAELVALVKARLESKARIAALGSAWSGPPAEPLPRDQPATRCGYGIRALPQKPDRAEIVARPRHDYHGSTRDDV